MYFPTLDTMKDLKIDDFLIKKLDTWLGTRRKATRKHLCPLQFSIDTDIDEDTSIELFAICTDKEIKILREKYIITCPNCCDKILNVYYTPEQIPDIIYCNECDRTIRVREEMITIWFELMLIPNPSPISNASGSTTTTNSGNGGGLSAERLRQTKSPMALRLATCFNERFRQA
ncbi:MULTISPECIES: hypothetical protein [Bacillus cereus group]|uniref:hypothetical protein n=1 Tax=Bacillus cereus group TaxID=86661 RepID=UPI0011C9B4F4|nr:MULTISPECIES: hypothetical protein [Bacillus cereus group]MEB8929886.1 hypothetical protein [Bacillus cereus]MBZ8120541.1 hypothetical protein [Bacillus thuringiensis]MCR6786161.1 hypothetical protein [Bacillus thuringiensis]MCR6826415.1 hypothetical protein [Bacillus thuringiensis]MCR6832290.1 hypothetical protein [Bacillus thuringiensis]